MLRLRATSVLVLGIGAALVLAAPFVAENTVLRLIVRIAVYGLLAMSVNLALGVTGLPSLAGGLFFGVGGYAVALTSYHLELSPMWMLLGAPVFGAVLAAVTGLFVFRAKELYFALITLGLAQTFFVIVVQWYSVTKGDDGIHGIQLPDTFNDVRNRYWLAVGVVILCVVLLRIIVSSPFGSTLMAIRQNHDRVQSLGLRPRTHEFTCWVLSGAFGAVAGSLLVLFNRTASPGVFHWSFSTVPLLECIIGGASFFFGPIVGAAFAELVQEYARSWSGRTNLIYGLAALAVATSGRDGVLGVVRDVSRWVRGLRRRRRVVPTPSDEVTPSVEPVR